MRPTTADDNVFDFNALLHPGTVFNHPRDVVADPTLSISEKRAILASWASDASAIASCPALRAPEGLKAPVTIDEILDEGLVAHVGFVHEDQPYVIPMLYARVGDTVYIHGSSASRMLRALRDSGRACEQKRFGRLHMQYLGEWDRERTGCES